MDKPRTANQNPTEERLERAIRDAMKRRGVSGYDLAKKLEVKQPSVAPLITRKRGKIPESLIGLLNALDLELVAVPRNSSSQ